MGSLTEELRRDLPVLALSRFAHTVLSAAGRLTCARRQMAKSRYVTVGQGSARIAESRQIVSIQEVLA
jgi:hypothetical protein